MIELVVRLAFSLAVVLGLVTLLARVSAKRFRGSSDAPVRVVHRQALSRGSAVAVVSVGSRVLVVGTTEQQVSLLTELDPAELDGFHGSQDSDDSHDGASTEGTAADFDAELAAVLDAGLRSEAATVTSVPAVGGPAAEGPAAGTRPADVRPAGAHKRTKAAAPARVRTAGLPAGVPQGMFAGSALSPQTWRQAIAVATRRQQDAS